MTTVQAHLEDLPERALRRSSRVLAEAFGRNLLISTLHAGERLEDADEATRDDLDALAGAVPDGRLGRTLGIRDAASPEPAMLTAIRQAEGASPRLPAVLVPHAPDEAETLLSEAAAAGFAPGGAGSRRPIGLRFSNMRSVGLSGGEIEVGAGASWDALETAAEAAGFGVPQAALSGRFETPAAAAAAGLFQRATLNRVRGEITGARFALPPAAVGATDRSWLVPPEAGEALFDEVQALYAPLYAELLSPLDAALLQAGGALAAAPKGRALLRVAAEGTRGVNAAVMRGIDKAARRAGARLCRRGPLPPEGLTLALAAASGAAKIELSDRPADLPNGAVVAPHAVAVRGQVRRGHVVWYPRDLARSLDQAGAIAGIGDASTRPGKPPKEADDGWEALRAALAAALP